MEEIVLADNGTTSSISVVSFASSGCNSPRSSRVEESIDELTKQFMQSVVVPCLQKIAHEILSSHQRIQAIAKTQSELSTAATIMSSALHTPRDLDLAMTQKTEVKERERKASRPVGLNFRRGRKLYVQFFSFSH
jgi:hypothetical protein